MRIKKRWYSKPFTEKNVRSVSENPGVYMLMGGNGAVRYVGYSSNLRQQLLEHLTACFKFSQKLVDTFGSMKRKT
jgi:excinuclease UvrABC nuclease subunit